MVALIFAVLGTIFVGAGLLFSVFFGQSDDGSDGCFSVFLTCFGVVFFCLSASLDAFDDGVVAAAKGSHVAIPSIDEETGEATRWRVVRRGAE